MIGKAIHEILKANPTLAPLPVSPLVTAQGLSMPFIAYQVNSVNPSKVKVGNSRLDVIDITLIVYSRLYSETSILTEAIRNSLDGFCGQAGGLNFQQITFDGSDDDYDTESESFGQVMEFSARMVKLTIVFVDYDEKDYSLIDYNVSS